LELKFKDMTPISKVVKYWFIEMEGCHSEENLPRCGFGCLSSLIVAVLLQFYLPKNNSVKKKKKRMCAHE